MNAKLEIVAVLLLAITAPLAVVLSYGYAYADGPINQVCKASSIKEWGHYTENGNDTWTVQCCGSASRVDGGEVAFLPEHGACESATAATKATALSTCRTNWAAKRCP